MSSISTGNPVITFRADASVELGYGHVRRTLTVAERLLKQGGALVQYLMAEDSDGHMPVSKGIELLRLRQTGPGEVIKMLDPNKGPLVLDTYALTEEDLNAYRKAGFCTVVFDDARRLEHYNANVVVDSSPAAKGLSYRGEPDTRFLLGPAYYPLREEFIAARVERDRLRCKGRLVVAFGGSDPFSQTLRLLRLFRKKDVASDIYVLIGPGYEGSAIDEFGGIPAITFQRNVDNVAVVLASAELAVSGAGGTAIECAYLGVPSVLVTLSKDQEPIARSLGESGAAKSIGWHDQLSDETLFSTIQELQSDSRRLAEMGAAGMRLFDGKGAARISQAVISAWRVHVGKVGATARSS